MSLSSNSGALYLTCAEKLHDYFTVLPATMPDYIQSAVDDDIKSVYAYRASQISYDRTQSSQMASQHLPSSSSFSSSSSTSTSSSSSSSSELGNQYDELPPPSQLLLNVKWRSKDALLLVTVTDGSRVWQAVLGREEIDAHVR